MKSLLFRAWWIRGLFWGFVMIIGMTVILPLIESNQISLRKVLIGIPIYLLVGLLFGWILFRPVRK